MGNSQRWKNKGMYVSLLAAIPMILNFFGVQVVPEQWGAVEDVVNAALSLLVVLGILNNPTTEVTGFQDDKKEEI